MKLSFEKKLNLIFLIVLIILLNVVYFSINNSYNNSYFWVSHTYQVLKKSDEVSNALKNLQNTELDIILEPETKSIKLYDSLKNTIGINIAELKVLTKDNPNQQINIDNLITLLNVNAFNSSDTFEISQKEKANLISFKNKNLKIDNLIYTIQQEENKLMAIRQHRSETTLAYFNNRFILLIILIIFLLIVVYLIIKRGQRNENEFNSELVFANQRILNIIESIGDPFFVINLSKTFIYVNSSAANKTGCSKQKLIGKTTSETAQLLDDEFLETKIDEAFLTKLPVTYQIYNAALNEWYDKIIYPTTEGFTIYEKNITPKKIAENELLKTKRLLEETNEIANIGGWEVDLVNPAVNWTLITRAILEVSPEYMTDLDTALEFYPEGENRERITRVINEAVEFGTSFNEELDMVSVKGNHRWVKVKGKSEFKEGKCIRVYGTFHDLTEEKKLKEQIKLKEQLFTQAFKYGGAGIALISLEGIITDANESICKMFGYKREELQNVNFNVLTYPPDIDKNIDILKDASNGKFEKAHLEKRCLPKDGSIVCIHVNFSLLKDDKGETVNIISHVIDITEKKNAEQNLQDSEQKFRELFQFLPTGIALLDIEQEHYLEINESLLNLSGYSKEEFVQLSYRDRTPEEYLAQDAIEEEKLMLTGHCGPYRKKLIRKNGALYPVLIEAIKFTNHNGKALVLAVVQDISELELKEQQFSELNILLQKSNINLANINEELAQFSYIVSHDLKEPLRMITSFMDLLQKRYAAQLDDKANSFINLAVDGGRRMQKMIGDLLLYSNTGQNFNGKETVELGTLVNEVELNLYKQINESHTTIVIENPSADLLVFKSEILRLFQNLISNAIKFSKKDAKPTIQINCIDANDHWQISIKDNGIGMDSKNLKKIFDVFTRLHAVNEYEGTGIGLAICKKIVKQHKGNIWAESVPDNGSTFYFTLNK